MARSRPAVRSGRTAATGGASGGWKGQLQYTTAVDSTGNPTSWSTLTTVRDTTAGLTQSGRITFDPKGQNADLSVVHFVETQTDLSWKGLSWQ